MTDLRSHLQTIHDDHGRLTPAIVVDVARDPAHPLHPRLEWDDAVAGHAYRIDQAHRLIQSVTITYREPTQTSPGTTGRAFLAVRDESGWAYQPAHDVAANPIVAKLVASEMEREWRALRRRYEAFEEFWAMVAADLKAA